MKSKKSNYGPTRVLKGERTRRQILRKAVDIASVEGLNGLTIGELAVDLNMSKSGLYSHFGSKEELQMATIDRAREVFVGEVVDAAEEAENGLIKLYAFLDKWLSHIERPTFSGGSFFAAAALELDDRPGRPRNFVAEISERWLKTLEKEAKLAVRLGELTKTCDARLLVFQLYGNVHQANWFFRLHREEDAFDLARRSIVQNLRSFTTGLGDEVLDAMSQRAGKRGRDNVICPLSTGSRS